MVHAQRVVAIEVAWIYTTVSIDALVLLTKMIPQNLFAEEGAKRCIDDNADSTLNELRTAFEEQ